MPYNGNLIIDYKEYLIGLSSNSISLVYFYCFIKFEILILSRKYSSQNLKTLLRATKMFTHFFPPHLWKSTVVLPSARTVGNWLYFGEIESRGVRNCERPFFPLVPKWGSTKSGSFSLAESWRNKRLWWGSRRVGVFFRGGGEIA